MFENETEEEEKDDDDDDDDDDDAYNNLLHFQSESDNPCCKWRSSGCSGVFDGAGVPQICGSLSNKYRTIRMVDLEALGS
jgi:hypothetical protein